MSLEELKSEMFTPHLDEVFEMRTRDSSVDLKLIAVDVLAARPSAGRQPFSLVFRGPLPLVWPQSIYKLLHPRLGALEVFLVPIGRDELGVKYEAVFT